MLQDVKKRARRRGWGIVGFCGPNGGGKSAAMVWDTLPSLEAGRRVLSTVRLLDYRNPRECPGCDELGHLQFRPVPRPEFLDALRAGDDVTDWTHEERYESVFAGVHRAAHPLYEPLTEWQQLLDARACDVLLDEVTGVASSRESAGLPAPVANKLVQLRRADVVVRWSAPAWARADKIIRETSQVVVYCKGYLPKTSTDVDRMWRQRRLFRWKTYDATEFEDFTAGKRDELPCLVNDWHFGPRSPVFAAYDTFDSVAVVGTVTDAGRCYQCGGKRDAPKCACPDYLARRSPSAVARGRRVAPTAPVVAPPDRVPLTLLGVND